MLYCQRCLRLCSDDKCPECLRSSKLREPRPEDPVLADTRNSVWAGIIKQALEEEGIVNFMRGAYGVAAETILGSAVSTYNIYVSYADYDRAMEIIGDIPDEDAEGGKIEFADEEIEKMFNEDDESDDN